ncbi:MAG: hypothetical protein SR2Q5_06310 [Quinella sp. 2Q5]|nr:hypothetical protein [Quinella sp. 2Q5]
MNKFFLTVLVVTAFVFGGCGGQSEPKADSEPATNAAKTERHRKPKRHRRPGRR